MRQQKFRAWDGEQMICPVAISKSGLAMIEQNPKEDKYGCVTVVKKDGGLIDYYADWATYQTFDYPLMQFIGRNDKNGKEIFEGDLLKKSGKTKIQVCNNDKIVESLYWQISKVVFIEGCFKQIIIAQENSYFGVIPSRPIDIFQPNEHLEVIGNIYENTEFLKEKY